MAYRQQLTLSITNINKSIQLDAKHQLAHGVQKVIG